jgi:hypothetical protein
MTLAPSLRLMNILVSLFALFVVGLVPDVVQAAPKAAEKCLTKACFALHKTASNGDELHIIGASRYRFWGFSVYSIALYQGVGTAAERWSEYPLALELSYHRSLKAEDFTKTAKKLMEENPEYGKQVESDVFQRFASFIQPVSEGDRYTLLYSPDGTLELLFNGETQGKVQDQSFARAYLGMWLGKYAVKEENRDVILSGRFEG